MNTNNRLLTETELELMNIIWTLKEGSVHDVIALLPKNRDLAYTSVSTILRILEKKGILLSKKNGRTHIYIPTISREQYGIQTVDYMVSNVFSETPSALAKTLIASKNISAEELQEIKELINRRMKNGD